MINPFVRCLAVSLILAGAACSAPAHDVVTRDVAFPHGDLQLSGTLFAPDHNGTFPAMVLMPGSGNETREPLLGIARDFAAAGMVTLVYDKQGSGKSGGDWTREDLDDLAGDGLAAIRLLRDTPHVDPHSIGAWGISQSGWVLPRLAADHPGVNQPDLNQPDLNQPALAFLICVTGGGATPREVEYFGYHNKLLHAGFTEGDWNAARPLIDRYMQYLATGQDRTGLLAAIASTQDKQWSATLNLKRVMPDQADYAKWSWVPTYDPAADIRALHMPVLAIIGGRDPFAPSTIAIQRWQEGLAVAANPHDLVVSYPAAGHGIRTNGHDMHAAPVYAPGYLDGQLNWLRSLGVLR